MAGTSAPNRILDLEDLERESFRRVLAEMDDLLAREPDSYLHPSKRWEYPWALEQARLGPRQKILDAGSGASIFPIYLAHRGHQVTAVDLQVARRLGKSTGVSVDYVEADVVALPFGDGVFDGIFCISVIEHLPEEAIAKALEELRRVLRPGGRLLLTTDYYHDADAEIWYEGPDRRFRVDWGVFDEARLRRCILDAPGWRVDGDVDLKVDWAEMVPRVRRFHVYPYTSVGVTLVNAAPGTRDGGTREGGGS